MEIENLLQRNSVDKISSLLKEVYQLHIQLYSETRKWKKLFRGKCEENERLLLQISSLQADSIANNTKIYRFNNNNKNDGSKNHKNVSLAQKEQCSLKELIFPEVAINNKEDSIQKLYTNYFHKNANIKDKNKEVSHLHNIISKKIYDDKSNILEAKHNHINNSIILKASHIKDIFSDTAAIADTSSKIGDFKSSVNAAIGHINSVILSTIPIENAANKTLELSFLSEDVSEMLIDNIKNPLDKDNKKIVNFDVLQITKDKSMKDNKADNQLIYNQRNKDANDNFDNINSLIKSNSVKNILISESENLHYESAKKDANSINVEPLVPQTQDFNLFKSKIDINLDNIIMVPETIEIENLPFEIIKSESNVNKAIRQDNNISRDIDYTKINNLPDRNVVNIVNRNKDSSYDKSTKLNTSKEVTSINRKFNNNDNLNSNCSENKILYSSKSNNSQYTYEDIDFFFKSQDKDCEDKNFNSKPTEISKIDSEANVEIKSQIEYIQINSNISECNLDENLSNEYTLNNNDIIKKKNNNYGKLSSHFNKGKNIKNNLSRYTSRHNSSKNHLNNKISPLNKSPISINQKHLRNYTIDSMIHQNSRDNMNFNKNESVNQEENYLSNFLNIDQLVEITSQSSSFQSKNAGTNLGHKMLNPYSNGSCLNDSSYVNELIENGEAICKENNDRIFPVQNKLNNRNSTSNNIFYNNISNFNNLDFSLTDETNLNTTIVTPNVSPQKIKINSNNSSDTICHEINLTSNPLYVKSVNNHNYNDSDKYFLNEIRCTKESAVNLNNKNCINNLDLDETYDPYFDGNSKAVFGENCITNSLTNDESFYSNKRRKNDAGYAYVDVIRKKNERQQLNAVACEQCSLWFESMGMSEEERVDRMKHCRHKFRFEPSSTPEQFWTIGFPDTQQCKEKGYMAEEKVKPSKFRRRKQLRKMF